MNSILEMVAIVQYPGLKIPKIHNAAIARYKHIIALKILCISIVDGVKSKRKKKIFPFPDPYTKAIGITTAAEIIR